MTGSTGEITGQDFDAYLAPLYTAKAGPEKKKQSRSVAPFRQGNRPLGRAVHFNYDETRSNGFSIEQSRLEHPFPPASNCVEWAYP